MPIEPLLNWGALALHLRLQLPSRGMPTRMKGNWRAIADYSAALDLEPGTSSRVSVGVDAAAR